MVRFLRCAVLIALIISTFVFIFTPVRAQVDPTLDISIGSVSTLETPDSMVLKVYFNIYDPKTSLSVLDNITKSAQITLPQSTNFTADTQIKKPDVPIYVVLVLDSSGSMGGAAEDLKKAAKQALENTPNDSYFSVVKFDESISLLQDFTQNIYAVSAAIDRYAVAPKGTCLYDAAYSAVESLQKTAIAGRRAIILFTDGKDENQDGKVCSKHTYQELTDLAMKDQVPINAIGLSYKKGNVNEVELNSMAASTGGFAAIATQDNNGMSQAFTNIMNALKSQWMVETNIYPRRGANTVTMTLNLEDDQVLSKSFSITSNTEYPGPPSPVTLSRADLVPNAPQQTYDLHLSLTSPELVDHFEISVKDGNAGTTIVKKYPLFTKLTTDPLPLSIQSLTFGSAYQLSIMAFSKKDDTPFAMCKDQNGKSQTECLIPFTFDASFYPSLTFQPAKEDENSNLLLDINVTQPELVGGFEGWLVDENTNNQVANSEFKLPFTQPIPNELTIPLRTKHIPDGKYTLMVRLLNPNGDVYADISPASIEVSYTAPPWWEQLIVGLITYWPITFIILLIIGFAFWFMRLNVKRGKIAVQPPIMAIADDELILPQGKSSYRSPAKPITHPAKSTASVSEWSAAGPTIIQDKSPAQNNAAVISSAQATQTAQITVLQSANGMSQSSTLVNQFPFIIGRIEAHLILKDPNLSRRHAQITYDDARREYFLTDLGSSNGTYLDNQRLIPNQPMRISNGAIIKLGTKAIVRFDLY